jgi:hypothetical protein
LFEAARGVCGADAIVEIGGFKGRSTCDHRLTAVREDWGRWLPFVRDGVAIGVHDSWPLGRVRRLIPAI